MATFDLYGCSPADIEKTRYFLETALGIKFECRNSTYHDGDYFFYGDRSSENFVLKRNRDPFDGDPVETLFPEYPILFYVNDTTRSLDLQTAITQQTNAVILLRHEEIE